MKVPDERLDRYGGWREVQAKATGFFRVQEVAGRWWFITPEGNGFISMGMNHLDLNVLKYPDNIHIWRERYGGSEERYIQEGIAQPLREWGFNTIGWTEETVAGEWMNPKTLIRHSPEWSHRQYQLAGMPYCHGLHFADIEDFGTNPHYPDVFSQDFQLWADYVARKSCVDMADDPLLIGYFMCPRPAFERQSPGSWADGLDLSDENDRKTLHETVLKYYQVVTESIRRYDSHHMILGNRFNSPSGTVDWCLEIAKDYVDVILANWWMSDLAGVTGTLDRWHELTGKPILIADSAFLAPTALRPTGSGPSFLPSQRARGEAYQRFATEALSTPYVLGWHWCAYIENRVRKSGLKSYLDEPYWDCVDLVREFNNQRLYSVVSGVLGTGRDEREKLDD